jgi:hypothetical protein
MKRVEQCDLCGQPRCAEGYCFRLQCYRRNGAWFDVRGKLIRWVKKGADVLGTERNVGVGERRGVTTPMSVSVAMSQGVFDWGATHSDPTA